MESDGDLVAVYWSFWDQVNQKVLFEFDFFHGKLVKLWEEGIIVVTEGVNGQCWIILH